MANQRALWADPNVRRERQARAEAFMGRPMEFDDECAEMKSSKDWREPGNSTGRRRVPFAAMIHFGPSCWEWLGGKYLCGYGQYNDRSIGKMVEAHRYSFAMINGPIPSGLHVLHKCDNRACVRHDHLFLGTALDNARDMVAKGRHANQKKTHCPSGHEYTDENTYRYRNERQCRICKRRKGTESKRRTRRAANGN